MSLQKIEAGSEVFIRARVLDQRTDPPALFSPATDVRILLSRPDDTIAVSYATMTAAGTGIYTYTYQTTTVDMAGVWRAQIKTTDGTSIVIRSSVAAFELLSTTPAGALVTQTAGAAPAAAKYIVQQPDASLTNEQALSALATGIMVSTTTTGVITTGSLSGDVTTAGGLVTTLATTGVGSGTYGEVQVNTKGLVIAGTVVTSLGRGGTGSTIGPISIMPAMIGAAVAAGSTVFLGPRAQAATETAVAFISPISGTIVRIDTQASGAPVGAETYAYRPRVAAADVGATQTVTGSATTSTSGAISVSVTAGDLVSCKLITSAGAVVVNHTATFAIRATS